MKRDLFARIQARGERATPALVEKELAALERAQAAQAAIEAVRAAGGTAHYFSVNLTDAVAVAKVIKQVRERSGRIDVLLHAAGIERSHFLPDKDPRGIRSCLRREERWLVQSSYMLSVTCQLGIDRRIQFNCRTLRQCGTNGLQRGKRSAMQDHLEFPHHPARDSRHRHRLDGMGRHRHGYARLHPQDDGTRRHRHAANGGRNSSDSPRTHCGRHQG